MTGCREVCGWPAGPDSVSWMSHTRPVLHPAVAWSNLLSAAMPANIDLIRRTLCSSSWIADRVALYGTGRGGSTGGSRFSLSWGPELGLACWPVAPQMLTLRSVTIMLSQHSLTLAVTACIGGLTCHLEDACAQCIHCFTCHVVNMELLTVCVCWCVCCQVLVTRSASASSSVRAPTVVTASSAATEQTGMHTWPKAIRWGSRQLQCRTATTAGTCTTLPACTTPQAAVATLWLQL